MDKKESINYDKYLVLMIGNAEYGIKLSEVKEIVGLMNKRMIPDSPDYFYGLINLRNHIIPVIDLRKKLGIKCPIFDDKKTNIIIVEDKGKAFGLVVDEVIRVQKIETHKINININLNEDPDNEYIKGVTIKENTGEILLLLDISAVLGVFSLQLNKFKKR